MIEIKASDRTDLAWPEDWTEVTFKVNEVINYFRWDIRINNIVYSGSSPGLFSAIKKEITWKMLTKQMLK